MTPFKAKDWNVGHPVVSTQRDRPKRILGPSERPGNPRGPRGHGPGVGAGRGEDANSAVSMVAKYVLSSR